VKILDEFRDAMRSPGTDLRSSAFIGGSVFPGRPGSKKERFQPPMNADERR
jgi:hypothetical protein